MNGLSLRVSTVKGNENLKKNSEIRLEILHLSTKFSELPEFEEFVAATTVEQQLNAIRKIGQCLKKSPPEDHVKVRNIIDALTEIYFQAPIKHGARNLIVKSFGQLPEHQIIIVDSVGCAILQSMQNSDIPLTIARIAACLENFKMGVLAVEQRLAEIFQFVKTVLVAFVDELGAIISPAGKNELGLNVHNAVRFVIACLHYFMTKCCNDLGLKEDIAAMYTTCYGLLEHKDLPMDTKTNSGIFVVLKCKIFNEDFRNLLTIDTTSEKKLCLCIGIISCLDRNFFDATDCVSKILEVAKVLEQIGMEFAVEPSIILGVSRGYLQVSKKLLILKLDPQLFATNSNHFLELLKICLFYSLGNLEHYMDSIRHLSRDLLTNVIKLSRKYNEDFLDEIFCHAMLEDTDNFNKNVQCMVLANLGVALSIKDIIIRIPDVVPNLLALLDPENQNNINLHTALTYEQLMSTHFNEVGVDIWTHYWVKPLILTLNTSSNTEVQKSLELLVRKAVKISPTVVFNIVQFQTTSNSNVVMACLGEAKKRGMFDVIESNDFMWKSILSFSSIRQAMVSEDDEIRLSALRLITESHRTTERMSTVELDCVLHFLKYNVNIQSPAARQHLMSSMQNMLLRVTGALQTVASKDPSAIASHDYTKFVLKLHRFCVENLFIGANFSRRSLSFKLLIVVCQILQDVNAMDHVWSEEQVQLLINCLEDTYEANARICVDVLKFVPKTYLTSTNISVKLISTLATSVKPADSVTAAYYLEFLTIIYPTEGNFPLHEKCSEHFPEIYKALIWCEQLLREALQLAQQSLLRAARENPLYGLIFCIRHLLDKVDMKIICQCESWRKFLARLIELSKSLSEVVKPVVNNSSPEGHLPNDFGDVPEHIDESRNDESQTTPQMVLLAAWRTVKEVSLLLGDLVFKAPIIRDYTNLNTNFTQTKDGVIGLLSVDQILDIFNFFTKLLSETKHRGAFEQAYSGFSRVCIRLWGAREEKLHQLPFQWLGKLLKLISGELDDDETPLISAEKICATRRSAGVPYMILALITSELQVCASTGLQFCMTSLIELCKSAKNLEARTHALNILRALYRCTDLGETIGEYVADGLKCAITGYGAETWPERNSSTLLFSALMVRVFGVQRTKDSDNLTIKNKMTGRIFFLRYPQLYDFFLIELKNASREVVNDEKSLKIHPMLLLLSRLYPSSLEGTESNLKLIEFLPLVSVCSGCPDLQTRCLAGKFIEIIIAPHMIFDRVLSTLKIIRESSGKANLNSVHGALLQIFYLLRSSKCETTKSEDHLTVYSELLLTAQHLNGNPILYATFLDIFAEFLIRNQSMFAVHYEDLGMDLTTLIIRIEEIVKQQIVGIPQLLKKLVILKLIACAMDTKRKVVDEFLLNPDSLTNYSYEYLETVLNLILILLDYVNVQKNSVDLEISEMQMSHVHDLFDEATQMRLKSQLLESKQFPEFINEVINKNVYNFCTIKAYIVASYSLECLRKISGRQNPKSGSTELIQYFVELSKNQTSQLETAIFKCVSQLVSHTTDFSGISLKMFYEIAAPEASDEMRATTVEMLSVISSYLLSDECNSFEFVVEYSYLTLLLLRDDSVEVRDKCSKIVINLCSKYNKSANSDNGSVVSSFAQEKYLRLLTNLMQKKNFTIVQMISVLLIVVGLLEHGGQEPDAECQVFDKSEANIYGEIFITEKLCIDEARHLLKTKNIDNLDISQLNEVAELTQKFCSKHRLEYVQGISINFQQP